MDGSRQRQGRRIVVVWRNSDGLGFGGGGDVHQFENPAAVRDVGIENVDGARSKDRTKTRAREQRLPTHDRNAARVADLRKRLDVLRRAGLLEPIGANSASALARSM